MVTNDHYANYMAFSITIYTSTIVRLDKNINYYPDLKFLVFDSI